MFLAFREIRRRKSRFALLGGAVGLLVLLLLFFQSVASTLTGALTGAIENQTAEVVVYDARARQNPAASVLPMATIDAVAAVDGVAEAAGVVQTFVTVTDQDRAQFEAVLVGIEPGLPGTPSQIVAGKLPTAPGEALVSVSGFEAGYQLGAKLTVTPGDATLRVVGVAKDATASAATTLYTSQSTFYDVLKTGSSNDTSESAQRVSWIGVSPADGVDATALAERITNEVAGVDALDRAAAVAALPGVDTVSQSFGILYLLLYIVVTIVTGVFFLILTVQKRNALVLLRAIGARRRDVVVPVLIQIVVVVGIGAVAGAVVTATLLQAAKDVFGTTLELATAATTSGVILALGMLAGIAAVRRVLAIEPVEATMPGGLE